MKQKNTWHTYDEKQVQETEAFVKGYMTYLDEAKTERESVDVIVNMAEEKGYVELDRLMNGKNQVKAGDLVYAVHQNKMIVLVKVGSRPMSEGVNLLGAHMDSPRLDVKQNPLYESDGIAYLDTHYYGGIKKYQWVATPLALHGVVVKKDGTTVEVNIGENEDDPVLFVSDLLVHLAQEQMDKKASLFIKGEALDLVVGSRPEDSEQKEAVKARILQILRDYYEMEEEDFLSAELEIVPAGHAREAGLDRSMIMAYGQDDSSCVYTALHALFDCEQSERTCVCIFVDKEEIGSHGATGMRSKFFENVLAEVMELKEGYNELQFRRCMMNSNFLSADVSSCFDPMYSDSFEKKNVAYLGCGIVINKYTGSRGKSGANDANAEFLAKIRNIFAEKQVNFQTAEYGRVDLGGSGTISHILAGYGMNVVDCGVAVMNMHAPYEVTSKADIYETKRGYQAFLELAD